MLKYEYQSSIIYWVVTTAHALERRVNVELAPMGITFRQAEVLAWLALEGDLSQVELADRMRIEAPTLAGIVARMEKSDWIIRETSPQDRRRKIIRPTQRVEPIWERLLEAGAAVRSLATRGLEPAEVQQLISLLERVQVNLPATGAVDSARKS